MTIFSGTGILTAAVGVSGYSIYKHLNKSSQDKKNENCSCKCCTESSLNCFEETSCLCTTTTDSSCCESGSNCKCCSTLEGKCCCCCEK